MMCSDHHFANNHMHIQFQPNQSFSRITDACSYLEGATHQQRNNGGQEAGDGSATDPRTVLTYLTFLEHKIGHLRGILCSTPHPQQQIVSAELSCIIVQLISISKTLVSGTGGEEAAPDGDARSPLSNATAHQDQLMGSDDDSDGQDGHHADADADEEEEHHPLLPPAGSYEVVQIEEEEILAPHVHSCKVCGKGFKRDANLRMHMRGHGDEYKTAAALARPPGGSATTATTRDAPAPETARRCFYSCPYVGCKRNREHRDFQPLKTAVCVKNHYRRSHCDKRYTCRRCNVKKFSVLADLRTHEKHCGRDRWVCSCGTSFSRKDKLFAHVAVFDGHTPALPPEDAAATVAGCGNDNGNGNGTGRGMPGSGQLLMGSENSVSTTVNMDQCFDDSVFDDFRCSDIKGSIMDDGRGYLSPMGLDSCDFDGFDLFGTHAIDFDF